MAVNFVAGTLTTPTNRPDVALGHFNQLEEPNLTVNNRVDPGNIAISSQSVILVSSDFFANFRTATYPNSRGDTWADFDSQGRLFWTNLDATTGGVGVTQVDLTGVPVPGVSVVVQIPPLVPGDSGLNQTDDRQALTADDNPNSPYRDNIYVDWTRFGTRGITASGDRLGTEVFVGSSNNQGQANSWTVRQVSDGNGPDDILGNNDDEGFVQQVTIDAAPNGDVYAAYHSQRLFNGNEPDGRTGQVFVVRSTDGGQNFQQKSRAFDPGAADIAFNRQEEAAGNFAGTQFLTQGSVQPVVLADQVRAGQVYVFAVDDPDNIHGNGDDADLVFARSTDNGVHWTRRTLETGGGSYQLFPTANVDQFGNMIVGWYDNRREQRNAAGNFLFDFYAMYSTDGGLTFSNPFMINDPTNPFDPDETPLVRFPKNDSPTTRIGEYFGMDLFGGTGYVVWNGNTPGDETTSQQLFFDAFAIAGSLTLTGDDAGVTDDSIELRNIAGNTDFIEVNLNSERQYAGLQEGLSGGITVEGRDGNDTLTIDFSNGDPIPTGRLTYDGGDGIDAVSYANSPSGVTVNLAAETAIDASGNTDILKNVETEVPP
jgi:hypothetical protein